MKIILIPAIIILWNIGYSQNNKKVVIWNVNAKVEYFISSDSFIISNLYKYSLLDGYYFCYFGSDMDTTEINSYGNYFSQYENLLYQPLSWNDSISLDTCFVFIDPAANGKWLKFFKTNGKIVILARKSVENHKIEGEYLLYHNNGNIHYLARFLKGHLICKQLFCADDNKMTIISNRDDTCRPYNYQIIFYNSGQIQEINLRKYKNKSIFYESICYYEDGKIKSVGKKDIQFRKQGEYILYDKKGNSIIKNYKDNY